MAAPRHRRRGFSRKVQYSLFAGYVIAVVGVVVAAALLVLAHFDPRAFSTLRGLTLDAGSMFTSAGRSGVRVGSDLLDEVTAYFDAGAQNRALRDQLASERRELIAAKTIKAENARLKRLALLVEHLPRPLLSARLIGSTPSAQRRFATLAAGSGDGVQPGMAVRAPEGLVGRIFETGIFSSRVLLLTDGETAVPVKMARNGVAGLASGQGDGTMEIRSLTAGGRPYRRGDIAVTSGTGGIYAPNIPVAVVIAIESDRAIAMPLADPARADFVLVYPIFQAPIADLPTQPKP